MKNIMRLAILVCVCVVVSGMRAYTEVDEKVDLSAINRIRTEAFQNSKVMDHLFYLTDVHGPRLSGSPGYRAAADWVVQTLKEWGMQNPHLESWGTFGRSWTLRRFDAHMLQPSYMPLTSFPKAWSSGTSGPKRADVIYAPLFMPWEDADRRDPAKLKARIQKYASEHKDKLRGKIVMIEPLRDLKPATEAATTRYDEKELTSIAVAPTPFPFVPYEWPVTHLPDDPKKRDEFYGSLPMEVKEDYWARMDLIWSELSAFLRDEGVAAVLYEDRRGTGGLVFAQEAGTFKAGTAIPPASVVVQPEQYNRMARLLEKNMQVVVEVEMDVDFPEEDQEGFNVAAELPGGLKKDELVMMGGHLDSWHSGTGATDNAAGCAVVMEAMRILKVLGLKMDRTVRLALWGGEEQGLFGSRGYVREHFADPLTMKLKPEHSKLSGYFNLDNGSGKIRGVYLQGNDMMRPIFEEWFEPFEDLEAKTITIQNTGGTDHLSFDAVGLPGFQFIQDPLDYDTRTHHSNVDVYDHIERGDLMQASAIVASIVYQTAVRPAMLPRKPLPAPLPPKKNVE